MSFLTVAVNVNFITVVSDGLVSHSLQNPSNIRNFQKFKTFGNKNFIAFTGAKAVGELIAGELAEKYNGQELTKVMDSLSSMLSTVDLKAGISGSFVIGGLNVRDEIEVHFMTTEDAAYKTVLIDADPEQVNMIFMTSPNTELKEVKKKMKDLVKQIGCNTPQQYIEAQKSLNTFVEASDSTVNKNTFELIIERN